MPFPADGLLARHVLANLSLKDRLRVSGLQRVWRAELDDPVLWARLVIADESYPPDLGAVGLHELEAGGAEQRGGMQRDSRAHVARQEVERCAAALLLPGSLFEASVPRRERASATCERACA